MLILLIGKFRHQVHVINCVNLRLCLELSEFLNFSIKIIDFISTPNLRCSLTVLFKIDLDLLQILKHLGMGFLEVIGRDKNWMNDSKIREWEGNVKKYG